MLNFKPLAITDFPLLLKWLQTKHVKRWYDQEVDWTLKLIAEKYINYTKGYKIEDGVQKNLYAFIIFSDTWPIGYIQFYDAYDFLRESEVKIIGLPNNLAAIDFFIGEENFLGKSLGARIVDEFIIKNVWPRFKACFVDPDINNIAAIKTYEKAGFKKVKTIERNQTIWMTRENQALS